MLTASWHWGWRCCCCPRHRRFSIANARFGRAEAIAPDMLVHHIGYYMFAWFGVHMSSKGEQWRDCIISGGWQVLACEALGAANGWVLIVRPVRCRSLRARRK